MPPAAKQAKKRPAAAMLRPASPTVPLSTVQQSTVQQSPVQQSTVHSAATGTEEKKKVPWNKGQKMSKSDMQHLFIPREDYELFLAVALYFAGPKYVMAFWLTMVTSRRISETLRLHGEDVFLEGGPHHDSPHILFKKRPEEEQYPGAGKLRGEYVVARLAPDACTTLEKVMTSNLERTLLPVLKPFEVSHPQVFQDKYPMATDTFKWPNGSGYIFPAATKKAKKPWMARQSVSLALSRTLEVMYSLTGKRRWNHTFKGSHVTVHGATRHTAAALLLAAPKEGTAAPTEHVILEIQQRHDVGTFRRHYCHAQEEEIKQALGHASVPVSFHAEAAGHQNPPAGEPETNLAPQPAANAPLPAAGSTVHCPAISRNAWRKQKRKEGKKAWKASQAQE